MRIILLILAAVLLPTFLLCTVSYLNESHTLHEATADLLTASAEHCANDVHQWLNDRKVTVKLLSLSMPVIRANDLWLHSAPNSPGHAEALRRMQHIGKILVEQESFMGEVSFADPQSKIVYFSTDKSSIGKPCLTPEALGRSGDQILSNGHVLVWQEHQSPSNAPSSEIGAARGYFSALVYKNAKPLCIFTVRVRAGSISSALLHSDVSILDYYGRIIQKSSKSASAPDELTTLTDQNGQPLPPLVEIEAFRKGEPCSHVLINGYKRPHGERMLSAWVVVPELQWIVLAEKPERILLDPLITALVETIVTNMCISVAFCLLALWFAHSLTSPLSELSNVALALAAGDRDIRCNWDRHDEVGIFAAAFDKMADSIQQSIQQLEVARDRAIEANRAKSRFLANMSHELRTPLNAIIGYSEMLIEDAEYNRSPLLDELRNMHLAGINLLSLINDILNLSKIEAGKMQLFFDSFNLEELLLEVQAGIKPLSNSVNAKLVVVNESKLTTITTDQAKLKQILATLLRNAVKHSPQGQVSLTVSDSNQSTCFAVQDSGHGMPPDQVAVIRNNRNTIDRTGERPYRAKGLSLTIVMKFLDMLGGYLEVETVAEEGTLMRAYIPLTPPNDNSSTKSSVRRG